MDYVSAVCITSENTIPLWLSGETAKGRRLISRIISAMADENNALMAEGEWDAVGMVAKAAAELAKHSMACQIAEEETEDEVV